MDGRTLWKGVYDILDEDIASSGFLDTRTIFERLNEAAVELCTITKCLTGDTTLTTVADQKTYNLPANFLAPNLRNSNGEYFFLYSDGTTTSEITLAREEEVIRDNNTTSVTRPSRFYIEDFELSTKTDTGTYTATGATAGDATAGKSTLTDSAATFAASGVDIQAGDTVHNTTDGSTGIVLSRTSTTALVTALFDGTDNQWDLNDAYTIVKQPRLRVVLDPPPSTASHTVTINGYIRRPDPVYSNYDTFGIPSHFSQALIKYAAWLYKFQGREEAKGDALYRYWLEQIGPYIKQTDRMRGKKGYKVRMKV